MVVHAWTGTESCRRLRLPGFIKSALEINEGVSLGTGRIYQQEIFPVLLCFTGRVKPGTFWFVAQ